MKIISDKELTDLVTGAKASARLRKNLNLHSQLEDPVQRLCNAFEPGTYVRPHRHPEADRWELFAVLKGEAVVLIFDESGVVQQCASISQDGPNYIIEIPPQTWHTLFSMKPGTILFEVKSGPYCALSDKDFADWAPEENTPQAKEFVQWCEQAKVGSRPPKLDA